MEEQLIENANLSHQREGVQSENMIDSINAIMGCSDQREVSSSDQTTEVLLYDNSDAICQPGPTLEGVLQDISNRQEVDFHLKEDTANSHNQNDDDDDDDDEAEEVENNIFDPVEKINDTDNNSEEQRDLKTQEKRTIEFQRFRELAHSILSNKTVKTFVSRHELFKIAEVSQATTRVLGYFKQPMKDINSDLQQFIDQLLDEKPEYDENESVMYQRQWNDLTTEFENPTLLETILLSILNYARTIEMNQIIASNEITNSRTNLEAANNHLNHIQVPEQPVIAQVVTTTEVVRESFRMRLLKNLFGIQEKIIEYIKNPLNIIRCLQLTVSIVFVSALMSIPDMSDQQVGYIFDWLAFNQGSNVLIWSGTVCYCCTQLLCVHWLWVRIIGNLTHEEAKRFVELFLEQNPVLQLSIVYMTDPKIIPNKLDQCIWACFFFTFTILKVFTLIGYSRMKFVLENINMSESAREVKSIRDIGRFCKIVLLSTVYTCGISVFLFQGIGTYRLVLMNFCGFLGIIESLKTISCTSSLKRHLRFYTDDANTESIHDPFFVREIFFDTLVHLAQFANSFQLIYNYIFKFSYEAIMHVWLLFLVKSIQGSFRLIRANFIAYRRFKWIESHLDVMFPRVPEAELSMNDICSICHDDLLVARKITKCGHRYHIKCLFNWLTSQKNSRCPICRAEMPNLNENIVEYPEFFMRIIDFMSRIKLIIFRCFGIQRNAQDEGEIAEQELQQVPQEELLQSQQNANNVQEAEAVAASAAINSAGVPLNPNRSMPVRTNWNRFQMNQLAYQSQQQAGQNALDEMVDAGAGGDGQEGEVNGEFDDEGEYEDEEGEYEQEDADDEVSFAQLQNWMSMSSGGQKSHPQLASEEGLLNLRNDLMNLQNVLQYAGPSEAAVSLLQNLQQKFEMEQQSLVNCLLNRINSSSLQQFQQHQQDNAHQLQQQEHESYDKNNNQNHIEHDQINSNRDNIQNRGDINVFEYEEQEVKQDEEESKDNIHYVDRLNEEIKRRISDEIERESDHGGCGEEVIESNQFSPSVEELQDKFLHENEEREVESKEIRDDLLDETISELMIHSVVESDDEFN